MTSIVEVDRRGNVALLRMRAGKANAMNVRLLEALDATLEDVDDADAIAITGEGSSFSAGLALPELILLDREHMLEMISIFEKVMKRVLAFPRATVAAINGHALAGGCVLALMCDARVMSAGKIGLNEIQLGIGLPTIVVEPVRLKIAPHAWGPIALEGRVMDPAEALRLGLVDEIVEPATLEARMIEIATARAAAPQAYMQIKKAFIAPALREWERRHEDAREAWLDTWFSDYAQRTLKATVDRITKR
jgi:enoyl-CoA hydratase